MRISNRTFLLVLAALLAVCLAASGIIWLTQRGGTVVLVTVNAQVYGTYDLHTDQIVLIGPEDGSWHNTLFIENGRAEIRESDCDNQICVHTPALTQDTVGLIVCLPHGVCVELKEQP